MALEKVSIAGKFALFDDRWSPKIVAEVNDVHVKLVKVEGDFVWHRHPREDELFLVVEGTLEMHYRDHDGRERLETLRSGEFLVVPRGTEHKPVAASGTKLVLIEPATTANTGDAGGERTAQTAWI